MVDDNKPLSVSDIEQKEQKIQTMLENNQNPVTEVSEQGAVQATVESLNNCMIPQGSATPDSNSSINAVVPNGTASSGTLLSGTVLQNSYLKMWDGEPLSEGKLYHRNEMIGLPECSIMENRDFWGRAEEWQKKCREVGMAQPAKYVRARICQTGRIYSCTIQQGKRRMGKGFRRFIGPVLLSNGRSRTCCGT